MTILEQLKEQTAVLYFESSQDKTAYDHCDNIDFVFDLKIYKCRYGDHEVEIHNLKVCEKDDFIEIKVSEAELEEIEKELLTKIEII